MDGVENPMAYASRTSNLVEKKFSSFDKECLAVVWATCYTYVYVL